MPTIRQKKAVANLVGNGGNVTRAMRDANYSEATINTPQKLTESKGFQELWEEIVPDNLLAERHLELLNKREKVIIEHKNEEGSDIYEVLDQPDTQAVSKGLDMAYKIKGTYAPERSQSIRVNIDTKVENKELEELREKYEEELKAKLLT